MKAINVNEVENGFVIYLSETNDTEGTIETSRVAHSSNHVAEIVYGFLSPKEEKPSDEQECEGDRNVKTEVDASQGGAYRYSALELAIRNAMSGELPKSVIERANVFDAFLRGKGE